MMTQDKQEDANVPTTIINSMILYTIMSSSMSSLMYIDRKINIGPEMAMEYTKAT